jgi:hypothetical protein
MKTRAVLIATSLCAATAMSAVAQPDQKKHQAAFCATLVKFRTDVTTLESTGPSSTMAELRSASDRLAMDADEVQRAAHKMKSPAAKQFTDSARQLREQIQSLPPNITVDQAKSRIQDDLQNVRQSAHKLATESGCPEPAPDQQPQQGTTTPPEQR